MSWVKRWKGKYVTIDPKHPSALGICDDSGFTFNHKDLVKQMEWVGDNLVWTGLMVGKPYVDKPNEQNRPPIVKSDPRPVKNPRIPQTEIEATFGIDEGGREGPPMLINVDPPPRLLLDSPSSSYSDPEVPQVLPYNQLLIKLQNINWNWEN